MKNDHRKPVVIGRLWEKEKQSRFLGYLEFGVLGRLRIRLIRNTRKDSTEDNDFILLADPEDTPFGMLGELRTAGRKLEDKIDQALWEGPDESAGDVNVETLLVATPVKEDEDHEP